MLRDELSADVHGEVDEPSWRLKQAMRRSQNVRNGKAFREYARQSFADTLTLYLHGICCDIDVDTGPRQLPSRYLRKRLLLLEELFPPPQGYAVFPNSSKRSVYFASTVKSQICGFILPSVYWISAYSPGSSGFIRPDPVEQVGFLLLEGFDLLDYLVHHFSSFTGRIDRFSTTRASLLRRQLDDFKALVIGQRK